MLVARAAPSSISDCGAMPPHGEEETWMSWKKPRIVEISVAMEINCYACAEV
jgi:coenzyme PQQ precursor peptide PqqA